MAKWEGLVPWQERIQRKHLLFHIIEQYCMKGLSRFSISRRDVSYPILPKIKLYRILRSGYNPTLGLVLIEMCFNLWPICQDKYTFLIRLHFHVGWPFRFFWNFRIIHSNSKSILNCWCLDKEIITEFSKFRSNSSIQNLAF